MGASKLIIIYIHQEFVTKWQTTTDSQDITSALYTQDFNYNYQIYYSTNGLFSTIVHKTTRSYYENT